MVERSDLFRTVRHAQYTISHSRSEYEQSDPFRMRTVRPVHVHPYAGRAPRPLTYTHTRIRMRHTPGVHNGRPTSATMRQRAANKATIIAPTGGQQGHICHDASLWPECPSAPTKHLIAPRPEARGPRPEAHGLRPTAHGQSAPTKHLIASKPEA